MAFDALHNPDTFDITTQWWSISLESCAWTIEFTNSLVNKYLFSDEFDGVISPYDSWFMLIRKSCWESTSLALATESYLLQCRTGIRFPIQAMVVWNINGENVFLVDVTLVKLRALNILTAVHALKTNQT